MVAARPPSPRSAYLLPSKVRTTPRIIKTRQAVATGNYLRPVPPEFDLTFLTDPSASRNSLRRQKRRVLVACRVDEAPASCRVRIQRPHPKHQLAVASESRGLIRRFNLSSSSFSSGSSTSAASDDFGLNHLQCSLYSIACCVNSGRSPRLEPGCATVLINSNLTVPPIDPPSLPVSESNLLSI